MGKILATSLSIGIGESGGIFAPSLFIGVTAGYATRTLTAGIATAPQVPWAVAAAAALTAVFAPLTVLLYQRK